LGKGQTAFPKSLWDSWQNRFQHRPAFHRSSVFCSILHGTV